MSRHYKTWGASAALLFLACGIALAADNVYKVLPNSSKKVTFTSDAPLELIHGNTNQVSGHIRYDDSFKFDARHPFDIQFTVDLDSIDTGIPLRNEHMRDNFLETRMYPQAIFKAVQIKTTAKPPFTAGEVIHLTATGPFTLHGHTMTKTIPIRITYHPQSAHQQNAVRIQARFPVALQEYHIQRPEIVFQKLAETVYVDIDLIAQKT